MELDRLTYIGHATVAIELDGTRLLTDPILRNRVAHLRRRSGVMAQLPVESPDAVLISHLHLDHCDVPSLHRLGTGTQLIVPQGAGRVLSARGFRRVEEIAPHESIRVGRLAVTAVPANHSGFRPPIGPTACAVGYIVAGSRRIYFAGDTDLFPEMSSLRNTLDIALLPIWGWGRSLGPGHLDPQRAAEALTMLRPRLAIPIHWGTFHTLTHVRDRARFLDEPPELFARYAAQRAPDVTVRILPPGSTMDLPARNGPATHPVPITAPNVHASPFA